MNLTLLLDLDDTLLVNPMDVFLPAYLQALSTHLTRHAEPQKLVKSLLAATQQMIEKNECEHTLEEIFNACFYPDLGLKEEDVKDDINTFYDNVFPTLKELTKPSPGAVSLVEQSFERGWRVIIATNPLFPETAIRQRLDWANLSPDTYPFELISSFETFHFAKPNPAYLSEVLARVGWPDTPVVMVGNDVENDIIPAQKVGISAFWVNQKSPSPITKSKTLVGHGTLKEIIPWIESRSPEDLQSNYNSQSAIIATLRSTPAALENLGTIVDSNKWSIRPEKSEWSITEILCHLRDVEKEVNISRIEKILNNSNPFLPGIDTDPWAEKRNYQQQDGTKALNQFTINRKSLLHLLQIMSSDDWNKKTRHAIFGPTDLHEIIKIIASHDRIHLNQILNTTKLLQ